MYYKKAVIDRFKILLIFLLTAVFPYRINGFQFSNKKLLIINLDGLGQEILNKHSARLPNIRMLYEKGSHPKYFYNQFPTLTLPNLFSIATGMYIEEHGVVGRNVYDPLSRSVINSTHKEFYQQKRNVKPLWVINEEQNGVSACLQWPGCGFSYQGVKETYHVPFSKGLYLSQLVEVALAVLVPNTPEMQTEPKKTSESTSESVYSTQTILDLLMVYNNNISSIKSPANLVMLYCPYPDITGHKYGTDSRKYEMSLAMVDKGIGHLFKRIKEEGLTDVLDVIVLSDHGMIDVTPDKVIKFSDKVQTNLFHAVGYSPLINVFPNHMFAGHTGEEDDSLMVYSQLTEEANNKSFDAVIKQSIPQSMHYKNNYRVAPIVLEAEPGYVMEDFAPFMDKNPQDRANPAYGVHGYSHNKSKDMLPIFVAVGPSFMQNVEVPSASNIDVYPLACHLLSLHHSAVNGTLLSLHLMLKQPVLLHPVYTYILAFCAILGIVGLLLALYWRCVRHKNRHTRFRNDPESLISGYVYRGDRTVALPPDDVFSFSDSRLRIVTTDVTPYTSSSPNQSRSESSRPSAIMMSEDEFEEEEKLLSREEEWEV